MDTNEYILGALCACPLFAGMTPGEVESIMGTTHYVLKTIPAKSLYALAGTPYQEAVILIKGEWLARMTAMSGKYVVIDRLIEGYMVAPAFLFAQDTHLPVTIEAISKTEYISILPDELMRLINENETIRKNFIRMLSNISTLLCEKLNTLSLLSVREKLAAFILKQAEKQGSDLVYLSVTRQELADHFGIQKYSLMRCFAELSQSNAIRVKGKEIVILNRYKLKNIEDLKTWKQ